MRSLKSERLTWGRLVRLSLLAEAAETSKQSSAKSSAATIPDEGTKKAEDKPLKETESLEDVSCDPLPIEPKASSYNKIEIEPIKKGSLTPKTPIS